MLQFQTRKSDRYSIVDQVRMALAAGFGWIQVTQADADLSLEQTLERVKELCEANDAFLTVNDDVELCDRARVHGVHLTAQGISPGAAREQLGADAIIGVDVATADNVVALKGRDIDYATVIPRLTVEQYRELIARVREADVDVHIVATNVELSDMEALRAAGVSGFALSAEIVDADDPEAAAKEIVSHLI